MALNAGFWIAEGFRGILLHRLTAAVSIAGLALSLWLCGMLYLVWGNLTGYKQSLFSAFQIDVFLDVNSSAETHSRLQEQISALPGITNTEYISTDEAAKIFARDFGDELFQVLDDNPLPASFKITLSPDYRNSARAQTVIDKIERLPEVDEVLFQGALLEDLNRRFHNFSRIVTYIAAAVFIGSALIFLQGMALSFRARQTYIYSTLLSGATANSLRLPFIIEGLLSGTLSGISALAALGLVQYAIAKFLTPFQFYDKTILLIPLGTIIGSLISFFSINYNLKKRLRIN